MYVIVFISVTFCLIKIIFTLPYSSLLILVRCAYFDSILRSECFDSASSTLNVDDVSEKTMRILLHFWYTGKLLPSWQDSDTVVEFVNAAGKYQITEILNMLNETLGETDSNKSPIYAVSLLEIVHKLSLKSAEQRLLDQLVKSMKDIRNGDEFFIQLGIKVSEADEPTKVEALEMLNEVLNEGKDIAISYRHVRLLGLLQKLSLNLLEEKLLAKIVKAANSVKTVEEFFVLFGFQQNLTTDTDNLLVRVLPDE